jgi:hypothetical protein
MSTPTLKGGDNVTVIKVNSNWTSIIGKQGVLCDKSDASDPTLLKVDFENGFIGYFKQDQLALTNDIVSHKDIIHLFEHMIHNKINTLEESQLEQIINVLKKS